MKYKSIFFLFIFFLFSLSGLSQVRVEETEMNIPTYRVGPDDPFPPFWNGRVYPYPMQTDITREKIEKTYDVVVLENEYIKVLILPELGGRILAALDKTNDNFDFIYHNHVIKPGLVALRGAWLSGGIEWNFPTLGHTVNTFSPVNHTILKNEDGSVTCVVGTEEWVRRMKWAVFITLFPDRSYFKTKIRLFNRTLTHNNAYFWANAATHAWEDTRVVFPRSHYTYAGGRRNPQSWPIYDARDVSWYKNTPYAHDYFCGTPGDFNGSYNYDHDHDNGTAHYAQRYESPGKKFWTWGTAPSGKIWEDLLTDEDGQYIEVQAGRLLTQGDTWIFEPHLVEEWDEWWYPLKRMKGFVKANPDAAINLEKTEEEVFFSLNTTREYNGAEIKLSQGSNQVFSERIDISPEGFFNKEIPLNINHEILTLEFFDEKGQEVIKYSTKIVDLPRPELQPDFSRQESDSAEITFLKGYYAMKHWNNERAIDFFKAALKRDPDHTQAMRWLGILYYKNGKIHDAFDLFKRILERNEDDYIARYYRALCKIRLGIKERTKEDLYKVSRRAAFRHVAPYVLASLEIKEGNLREAKELLKIILANNPDDTKTRAVLAAIERHLGNEKDAAEHLEEVQIRDPLSPLAVIEKHFQYEEISLNFLRDDPQYYLEVATDYMEMHFLEDAVRTLKLYVEIPKEMDHPIVFYYLGFLHHKLDLKEEAREYFQKASGMNPEYVFPFRTETELVLKLALRYNSLDWKAHYYLGNLLTSKNRWEEGLISFVDAANQYPPFSPLYRNLGEIYRKKLGDTQKAEAMYEKALFYSPEDYRLYVALDEIYAQNNNLEERDKLYKEASDSVRANFNYVLSRAKFLVDAARYEEALDILENNTFLPWEGWRGARQVFIQAHLERAEALMEEKRYTEAIVGFEAAMEYPENLGTGRPANPVFAREYYLIGLCYESLGDTEKAEEFFTKAAAQDI
ncbi:MAG: DUF5107 domain-containing protein, partial [Candidatus Aminicenantes bacterium]